MPCQQGDGQLQQVQPQTVQQNAGHKAPPRGGKAEKQRKLHAEIDDGQNGVDEKEKAQQQAHRQQRRVLGVAGHHGDGAQPLTQGDQNRQYRQHPQEIIPGVPQYGTYRSMHTTSSFTPG